MSRMALKEKKDAGPVTRVIYGISKRRFGGELPDPVGIFGHNPGVLVGYGAFEDMLARSKRVDPKLKELAVLKTAALVGCEWCLDYGSSVVSESGVTEEQVRELPRYAESEAFDDVEKLVIEYAEAATATPEQISDDLFGRLREHFDEAQLVELTANIAIENFRARFNAAFGLGSQGFTKSEVCAVPELGDLEAANA